MHVLILREGKEANQGVAYLDDGTMVVVDGAKRFVNKSIDITVTSVHQTMARKMILGAWMIGRSHRERWHGRRLPPGGAKPTGALLFPVRWTVQRGLFIRGAKPIKPSVLTEL